MKRDHAFDPECVCRSDDLVGESPIWCASERALYWVDIIGRAVRRLEPDTGRLDSWDMPTFPTVIAMRRAGGAVVALADGVYLFDFDQPPQLFCRVEPERPENRLNDGRCDRQGRLWLGTMYNNLNPDGSPRDITASTGAIFRVDSDGKVTRWTDPAFGITNTFAWSPDDASLYVADTLADEIYRFSFEPDSGALSQRRIFASKPGRGLPDGSCVDAEGYLWNARWGGGCLIRFAPNGQVDRVIELPITNPTSCTFGGADLATLYVTSARAGLSAQRIDSEPREGGVFAFQPGARGLPESEFAG
jgi:sugar lactone lactonase YvrE